jgi:hypothetical protein
VTDHYCTPHEWISRIGRLGRIVTDPCAATDPLLWFAKNNIALPSCDGLNVEWPGLWFCNPPFSKPNLPKWSQKCAEQGDIGNEGIALLPARTGSGWFHDNVIGRASAVCFKRGRISFVDPSIKRKTKGWGRVDLLFAYYGERVEDFMMVFADVGACCCA